MIMISKGAIIMQCKGEMIMICKGSIIMKCTWKIIVERKGMVPGGGEVAVVHRSSGLTGSSAVLRSMPDDGVSDCRRFEEGRRQPDDFF